MLLTDRKNLRATDKRRIVASPALEVMNTIGSPDGLISGRSGSGTPMRARIVGQSLVSRLAAEKKARLAKEAPLPRKRKRG